MPNLHELENAMPVAPLKICALPSAEKLGRRVNDYLVNFRKTVNNKAKNDPAFMGYSEQNYLCDFECPRFGSGEGKGVFHESIPSAAVRPMVCGCDMRQIPAVKTIRRKHLHRHDGVV